jgi:hypothetical protein
MVLTYDAYNTTLAEQKEKENELKIMKEQMNSMQSMMEKLIVGLSNTTDQQQLNTLAQSLFSSGVIKSTVSISAALSK